MSVRALLTAALCAAALTATSCSTSARLGGGRSRGTERRETAERVETAAATPLPPARTEAEKNAPKRDAHPPRTDSAAGVRAEVRDPSVPVHLPRWDTVNLFSYRGVTLADLPEVVAVELGEEYGYHAPAVGRRLSPYGIRSRRAHNGTDVAVTLGQPIHCAFDGVVRLSRWNSGGFGHIVIVRHPSGLETYYAHLSKRTVRAGEAVKAGQVIGLGGRTGRATATHLHFETRYCDQSFDAERLIDFATGELKTRTLLLRKEYFSINSHARDEIAPAAGDTPAYADATNGAATGDADSLATQTMLASDYVPPATASATSTAQTASPTATRPATDTAKPVYHKIRGGDTLYSLARRYGTTVAKLCSLNGISSRTTLRIGRSLRMK